MSRIGRLTVSSFAAAPLLFAFANSAGAQILSPEPEGAPVYEQALAAPSYTAANWPTELTQRPITLGKGMLELSGDFIVNLSKDRVGKPIYISPDIKFGVTDRLQVAVKTPYGGICLGKKADCPKVFDDVTLEGTFAMETGNVSFGAVGGVGFESFDPATVDLNVGVHAKVKAGKISITAEPSAAIGITERDAGNKLDISLPIAVAFQVTPELAPFAILATEGPVDHFGDNYRIAFAIGALYSLSSKLDVGGQFALPLLAAGDAIGGGTTDARSLDLFLNYRM